MVHDQSQRRICLSLARQAISTYLASSSIISPHAEDFLQVPLAAFVTLRIKDDLRGCIGTTEAESPLGETIIRYALAAAFRDPRFQPLTVQEFAEVRLEISVLSPFLDVMSTEEIEVGVHGIQITYGYARGLLLPQVAVEHGWDREMFLQYVCRKAGLPPDAWTKTGVKLQIFSAEIFGEEDETE